MEKELTFARAYNSALIAAEALEIFTREEFDDYLLNPKSIPKLYEEVIDKVNNIEVFDIFVQSHAATFISGLNTQSIKDSKDAIIEYHNWLKSYFKVVHIYETKSNLVVEMNNCPYRGLCTKLKSLGAQENYCIREKAIESAIELMSSKKPSVYVKKKNNKCYLIHPLAKDAEIDKYFNDLEREIKEEEIIGKEFEEELKFERFFHEIELEHPKSKNTIEELIKNGMK